MRLCGGDGLLPGTEDASEHQKQLKKKQKNRAAAQRSRQKHTDKADALHQQHESLEKHNHALRKEIQALRDELSWWSQTLRAHERLCPLGSAPCPALEPSGCWGQAEQPMGPRPQAHQKQPGLLPSPASPPPAQQVPPEAQSPSCPASSRPLGPTAVTTPAAQRPPTPAQPASPTGSSLLSPSSKFSPLLSRPPAQPASPQPLGQEHPTSGKLGPLLHCPSAPQGQGRDHNSAPSVSDLQGLEPSPHLLLAFPLLASAQVHF
ncbi:PREDICTED: basic leucine zipper transcriptional factor ATF-like 2 [Condylura cristata]|uniref:basic leucine zipper transcriptional factor ATF-like 2 n=1 Tax=Condylura cristata TaxID=143302 RepID=UPI000643C031|nr:PREDICTED: basic leucine zipper transcriptional factor ATF-like 2 [Condylura cristata]